MAVKGNVQPAATLPRGQNPVPLCIILLGQRFGKEKTANRKIRVF